MTFAVSENSPLSSITATSLGLLSVDPQRTPSQIEPVTSQVATDAVSLSQFVQQAMELAQSARADWQAKPLKSRLRIVHAIRLEIGRAPRVLAESVGRPNLGETLAAEVLPLADACRFLELNAGAILRERTVSRRGRPSWLWGTRVRIRREPFGVVLVIGPANYPLMLPGIHALQALVAGNVVLLKPSAGGVSAARTLVELARSKGLPSGALQVLPPSPDAVFMAVQRGVHKVVLTGSAAAGRSVGREAAAHLVPSILELSGCDAVFALEDADPERVSDCLLFGLTLNQGQTCIAPRRVFASDSMANAIIDRLLQKLSHRSQSMANSGESNHGVIPIQTAKQVAEVIDAARVEGAQLRTEAISGMGDERCLTQIAILDKVSPEMEVVRSDLFAPVVSFLRVKDEAQALDWSRHCPFALGASVFGSSPHCHQFARRIDAGCVVINDLIVPTADPRVPFSGRRMSGHGTTRGAAGLEEMTQLKAIVVPRRWFRPHLSEPTPVDVDVMEQLIRIEHAGSIGARLSAVPRMLASTFLQWKYRQSNRTRPS